MAEHSPQRSVLTTHHRIVFSGDDLDEIIIQFSCAILHVTFHQPCPWGPCLTSNSASTPPVSVSSAPAFHGTILRPLEVINMPPRFFWDSPCGPNELDLLRLLINHDQPNSSALRQRTAHNPTDRSTCSDLSQSVHASTRLTTSACVLLHLSFVRRRSTLGHLHPVEHVHTIVTRAKSRLDASCRSWRRIFHPTATSASSRVARQSEPCAP